jgi:transposase-like protein
MSKRMDAAKAQQWLERIEAFEQSGLSRRAWCTRAGINVNTLDYWRVRLRKRGHDKTCRPANGAVVTAIPVQVAVATASLTVRWGDIELHVPGSMPSAWLVALIRDLRGC